MGKYDLILKGGEVVDPAQGLRGRYDVGIADGLVAALAVDIPASEGSQIVDASGKLVVPGLIDIHAHLGAMHGDPAADPDDLGVRQGVVAVGDGGTMGYTNFVTEARRIAHGAATEIKWFVHLASRGLDRQPEITSAADIDPDRLLRMVADNRELVTGIKLRAIGSVAVALGPTAVREAQRVAKTFGLPLLVHVGACAHELDRPDLLDAAERYTAEVLDLLQPGDVLSHVYSPKKGGPIKADGTVLPQLRAAIARGVLLELAHGHTNFSTPVARAALNQGIIADIVATDMSVTSLPKREPGDAGRAQPWPANLARIMSKMLALGVSLEQVVAMATANPARALRQSERLGSLAIGMPANATVLAVEEGEFNFPDGLAPTETVGSRLLVPKWTVKAAGSRTEVFALA
ncbi:MAG: amidohydrolase family protein [Chloroflexota bacterium]